MDRVPSVQQRTPVQMAYPVEFQPLLQPGFHRMTIQELRRLCVDSFPQSSKRKSIMEGLEHVYSRIKAADLPVEIWVDGSFLTAKAEPEDSDIVVKVDSLVFSGGTPEQKETLEWIASNLRNDHFCHSHIYPIYPSDHPLVSHNEWYGAYWTKQFGFSRGDNLKGIAVIYTEAS